MDRLFEVEPIEDGDPELNSYAEVADVLLDKPIKDLAQLVLFDLESESI